MRKKTRDGQSLSVVPCLMVLELSSISKSVVFWLQPSPIRDLNYFPRRLQNFKPDQRSGRCGVSTLLTTLCSTPHCYLRPDLSRFPIASRDYNSRYYQDSIYYSSRTLTTQVGLTVIAPRELLGGNKAFTEVMLCSRTS